MGIYIKRNVYARELCDEFVLEKWAFPKEFIEKSRRVFYV